MQYQSISPDPKRDADAALLAQDGRSWPTYTLKRDHGAFPAGTVFYGVPSRSNPDHRWLANGVACQCPDYQQRGAMCAHVRAVRLFEQSQEQLQDGSAQEADPTPAPRRSYRDVMGVCGVLSCDMDREPGERYCSRHVLVDAF